LSADGSAVCFVLNGAILQNELRPRKFAI